MRLRSLLPAAALLSSIPFAHGQLPQPRTVLPLWPTAAPEAAAAAGPEHDVTTDKDALISGHRSARLTDVTQPTLTVYSPKQGTDGQGAAALVFPGGGYVRLAWDGEGLDTCDWLTSVGVTCLLVKYRVPFKERYPANPADLEDAQQAMRLARQHAAAWGIDPQKIGAVGFSAGAHLAVLLSTHPDDTHVLSTPAAPEVNAGTDARLNWAMVIYPGYLTAPPALQELDPVVKPNAFTPPTFLLQAENDPVHVQNALVYFRALAEAKVPTEMHLYPTGGHGFGVHPLNSPETHWTDLATTWLHTIGMLK